MVGKKSGRALLREEGLARTDNHLDLTIWPQVNMINQKNYYTEYLKRDEQYLALRTQDEERKESMKRDAINEDKARSGIDVNGNVVDDDAMLRVVEAHGSKIIVIHPGSQNLRVGVANDALPKTVPMVIARQARQNESEENGGEPEPKRLKTDDGEWEEPERMFGEEFSEQFQDMSFNLKQHMRANKRRLLPNSKELVVNYNRRTTPETISEHNDPHRIDWTELPPDPRKAPPYICGHAALRIAEQSRPRYKLYWPIRAGCLNEKDYSRKNAVWEDFFTIIEEAIKTQLGIKTRKDFKQYSCVFVIPDLYERTYVTTILDTLMRDFEFKRVCFMQESLAATFGAGWSAACIVDIGAQKTSICCVDEGLCQEESRINMKYGGADVTELFMKMMLYDHFPYQEINLRRRYDWLLAEELKQKFCTANEAEISVQLYEFHLRASGQDTRKYTFKTYDEVMLAPMGFFRPTIFNNVNKLDGRRKLIDRSYDIYDNSPNDPTSTAQTTVLEFAEKNLPPPINGSQPNDASNGLSAPSAVTEKPAIDSTPRPLNITRLTDTHEPTPRSSAANSPQPEGTPQPGRASPGPGAGDALGGLSGTSADAAAQKTAQAEHRDRILPLMPLDVAILESARQGHRGDDRKARDFYGGILLVGGGAKFPYFTSMLEERLRGLLPGYPKEILIGEVPRELDPMLVVWKGGSVFGRLSSSGNDSWVHQREYNFLGSKLLAQKCMWNW
ncbi:actin-like ATPase domain-containing protein [Rhizodiscina lignyota]|uniref:Actin-like ATPase domain-containing protein n=1 Tax=Rhizodiscina lignyota TaxID=1504668 RepID=A0A9P4M3U6_9PEZI|nr:actin-like ATPase domain-containing protein [Rhizodiscina lignyota]